MTDDPIDQWLAARGLSDAELKRRVERRKHRALVSSKLNSELLKKRAEALASGELKPSRPEFPPFAKSVAELRAEIKRLWRAIAIREWLEWNDVFCSPDALGHFADQIDERIEKHEAKMAKIRRQPDPRVEAACLSTIGVPVRASAAEIKAKYNARIRQLHPDANGGDHSMTSEFVEVTKAMARSGRWGGSDDHERTGIKGDCQGEGRREEPRDRRRAPRMRRRRFDGRRQLGVSERKAVIGFAVIKYPSGTVLVTPLGIEGPLDEDDEIAVILHASGAVEWPDGGSWSSIREFERYLAEMRASELRALETIIAGRDDAQT